MPFYYTSPPVDSDGIFGGPLAEFEQLIHLYADKYDLDPYRVGALVLIESSGNPDAVNITSRATGLGQVMPREAGKEFQHRPTIKELKDPETNIEWTCKILAHYVAGADGDFKKAVFAYTGGWYWVKKFGEEEADEMFENAVWHKFEKLTDGKNDNDA